ncbi:pectinacetylesterase family protein [Striga asiatica]|uniref:Pectin acetylesterase n=1 Tax=Striga asiatica TaxID=4170 RepID=A0A5A7QPV2_STRAF|nr:pectinacetylesterase family protein [Striga asiatica]
MLENNKTYNPDFYNWNRVYIVYCDGSSFLGDVEEVDPQTNVTYRGSRVFDAVIEDLFAKGLNNAENGLEKFLPASCTSKRNPGQCLFPEYLVEDIQTPLFILESSFDYHQSVAEAIGDWYFDRRSFRDIDTVDHVPRNCNSTLDHNAFNKTFNCSKPLFLFPVHEASWRDNPRCVKTLVPSRHGLLPGAAIDCPLVSVGSWHSSRSEDLGALAARHALRLGPVGLLLMPAAGGLIADSLLGRCPHAVVLGCPPTTDRDIDDICVEPTSEDNRPDHWFAAQSTATSTNASPIAIRHEWWLAVSCLSSPPPPPCDLNACDSETQSPPTLYGFIPVSIPIALLPSCRRRLAADSAAVPPASEFSGSAARSTFSVEP